MSLIGVDDHEFARVVALTTIRQQVADHGRDSPRVLSIASMAGTARTAGPMPSPVELVVRTTTGPVERAVAPHRARLTADSELARTRDRISNCLDATIRICKRLHQSGHMRRLPTMRGRTQ